MSVNYIEAGSIISLKFSTDWAAAGRTEKVVTPNESYTPPDPYNLPWLQYDIVGLTGDPESIGKEGNRRFDRDNQLVVEVNTPIGDGNTYLSNTLIQTVLDIFEGKKENGIWYKNGYAREVGPIDDKWYRSLIFINITFTEIK
jgi:hypothetical protein